MIIVCACIGEDGTGVIMVSWVQGNLELVLREREEREAGGGGKAASKTSPVQLLRREKVKVEFRGRKFHKGEEARGRLGRESCSNWKKQLGMDLHRVINFD